MATNSWYTTVCIAATARVGPSPVSACPAATTVPAAPWPAPWPAAWPWAKTWPARWNRPWPTPGAPCAMPSNWAMVSSCRAACPWTSAHENPAMKLRGLYAITDSQLLADGKLLPYVEAALQGGVRLLQYRDKSADEARRLREAQALRDLCERHGATLIINDDAELAARLGVGVHLGQSDGSLAAGRALLRPKAVIGATCHAQLELAEQAAREGASYVAFGRFFDSKTKPGAPTATLELLQLARS